MELTLQTTESVIDELGGNQAVSELTGTLNAKAVSNWRSSNLFPAWTYLILTTALQARGKAASDTLWKMEAPAKKPRQASASA